MREKGFLNRKGLTAKDLVADRKKARLVTIDRSATVAEAAHILTEHAYSQIPVTADGRLVGSVKRGAPLRADRQGPGAAEGPGDTGIMEPAFPFADISTGVDALAGMITPSRRPCWCATSRATRPTSSRAGT